MNPQDNQNNGQPPQQPMAPQYEQPQYYQQQQKKSIVPVIVLVVSAVLLMIVMPAILFFTSRDAGVNSNGSSSGEVANVVDPNEEQKALRVIDRARIYQAIEKYYTANNRLPNLEEVQNDVIPNYIENPISEPISGQAYIITGVDPTSMSEIQYSYASSCSDTGEIIGGTTDQFALAMYRDSTSIECLDNSNTIQ